MKQVRIYWASKFFFDCVAVYPFYVIIASQRGASESMIGWLLAIWSGSVILFELPAGIMSDRLSRRHILVAAAITKALAFMLWIPDLGFPGIALGFVLWGLSESLASGSEEAWLYETLHAKKQADCYTRIRGRGQFFASLGIAVAAPLGGLISGLGMQWVLVASIASTLVAGLCFLGFGDPPRTANAEASEGTSGGGNCLREIGPAWREISRHPIILRMVLLGSLMLLVSGVLDEWDPLLLDGMGLPYSLIGLWFTLRFLSEAAGAALSHRADGLLRTPTRLVVASMLCATPLLLLGGFPNALSLAPYAMFYLCYALIAVQVEARIQHHMEGSRRATVLSFRSLLDNTMGIAFILIAGYGADRFGLPALWIGGFIYLLAIGFLLLLINRKLKHR